MNDEPHIRVLKEAAVNKGRDTNSRAWVMVFVALWLLLAGVLLGVGLTSYLNEKDKAENTFDKVDFEGCKGPRISSLSGAYSPETRTLTIICTK